MSLTEERNYYKPFEYPWAFEAYKLQHQSHWIPEEVPMANDVRDFREKLTEDERELLQNLFSFFTQADSDVAGGYASLYLPTFKPPEIRMMLASFASMEAVHQDAYSQLLETLGLPEEKYKEFQEIKAMVDKHDFLYNFGVETPKDIAKTLAVFSAFTEGVQLFSSFAILLSFPRKNLMINMGQIITWSVRDECVSSDHEVLTPNGWVPFPELKDGEEVAQFDPDTGDISFVVPDRVVRKEYNGPLSGIDKRHFSILATPNHDILLEGGQKRKAGEFIPHQRKKIPTSGTINFHEKTQLTPLEKLKIAYAADGHKVVGKYRNGNLVGYQRVTFTLKKERKIERLKRIAEEAGIVCDVLGEDDSGRTRLAVNLPAGEAVKDLYSWVKLKNVNPQWAHEFLEEVVQWDGSTLDGRKVYCTTNKKDAELIQTIAHLADKAATFIVSEDDRKETYKTYYRVSLHDNNVTPSGVSTGKFTKEYNGLVYCVSVPTGCFLVRHNNKIHATGNSIHVEYMSKLFKQFIRENPEIWNDQLKYEIYCAAEKTVELEDSFIDVCFNKCKVDGLTAEEVKQYIRFIADRRLLGIGMKPIFGVKDNPLGWLDYLLNGVEHTNFFENRATEYSKGATTGSWNEVF